MRPEPVLRVTTPVDPVRGVALVLHGGRARGHGRVTPLQVAVLRMLPFIKALRDAGAAHGLAVASLRYSVRGWNGDEQSPVADVRWALQELSHRFPLAPVALVGHSMGGRAALYAADHPTVEAVVGLAPWFERGDPVELLADRRVLLVHGSRDRVTSARATAAVANQVATITKSVSYISITDDRHAMLKRARLWHELAAGFTLGALLDQSPRETADVDATNILSKALAGERSLVV